jgi:predicted DNA-binding ribbon-helix-helix protein
MKANHDQAAHQRRSLSVRGHVAASRAENQGWKHAVSALREAMPSALAVNHHREMVLVNVKTEKLFG